METLKILCAEWLHKNFGIAGEIKRVAIVGPENPIDLKLNLVGVAFEFQCPDGTTGDSVTFLDKDIVEWAPLLTIEETGPKKTYAYLDVMGKADVDQQGGGTQKPGGRGTPILSG